MSIYPIRRKVVPIVGETEKHEVLSSPSANQRGCRADAGSQRRRSFQPTVERLEDRLLLSADLDRAWVAQAYRDLLGRAPEPAGLAAWTAGLQAGLAPAQAALEIDSSPEYRTKLIQDMYITLLGRQPDAGGLDAFVSLLGAGNTVEQARAIFLGSSEYFQNRAMGNDAVFLADLYQVALHREVDPTGAATWGRMLAAGVSRTTVALDVLDSLEADQVQVTGFYQQYLGRAPDPAGFNYWVAARQHGLPDERIIALFVGSPEYFTHMVVPPEYFTNQAGQSPGLNEPGGADYPFYDMGDYLTNPTTASFYKPDNLKPVLALYNEHPDVVAQQLEFMYLRGQRKLALVLWFEDIPPAVRNQNGMYGPIVDSTGGIPSAQLVQNIRNVMQLVQSIGFNEIQLRFADQGTSSPMKWTQWEENIYEDNRNFIFAVRKVVEDTLSGSPVVRLYDLGAQRGGDSAGQTMQYTNRLWTDYTTAYGQGDTVGFSISVNPLNPGRVAAMIANGIRPNIYSLQAYDQVYQTVSSAYAQMQAAGEGNKPIMIAETYYNDQANYADFVKAAHDFDFKLHTIMEWPILPGTLASIGYSMEYPPEYANNLDATAPLPLSPAGAATRTEVIDPVLQAGGIGGATNDYLWLEGLNFADQFTVTVQSQGGSVLATLTNAQASLLIDSQGDQVLSFPVSNPSILISPLIVTITNVAYGTQAQLTISPPP